MTIVQYFKFILFIQHFNKEADFAPQCFTKANTYVFTYKHKSIKSAELVCQFSLVSVSLHKAQGHVGPADTSEIC